MNVSLTFYLRDKRTEFVQLEQEIADRILASLGSHQFLTIYNNETGNALIINQAHILSIVKQPMQEKST